MKKLTDNSSRRIRGLLTLSLLGATVTGAPLSAQHETLARASSEPIESSRLATTPATSKYRVVVNLDENRLYFQQGETTLWSAPVGTGTGMRVITKDDDWDFSTPTGTFQVEYKERNPVWIAPDWYYVENNLPVPPQNDRSRYMRGTLGEAAVYISPHLAIHGTDKPELIGQRVSHGCIRLENRYAKRLFSNVQVGTEVVIVGGEEHQGKGRVVDLRQGYDPSLASRGGRRTAPVDPVYAGWKEMDSEELLDELDKQLAVRGERTRWDEVAVLILDRARNGDEEALAGLFYAAGSIPTLEIEREWATFLADAYRHAPEAALEALATLDLRERREVANMMVAASLTLNGGSSSGVWPTSRIPREMVSMRAGRGWDSLQVAEQEHRSQLVRTASASE